MDSMRLECGDAEELIKSIPDNSLHAVVTDPPYGIFALNQDWDKLLPSIEVWKQCFRSLRPGGFLLSFGHCRVYHQVGMQLESIGFQIRDCLCWIYATGAPRPYNIDKNIDKYLGVPLKIDEYPYEPVTEKAKPWKGFANILKTAWEPIILAQKPIEGTLVENVLKYKTGVLNIDACRIPFVDEADRKSLESFAGFASADHGDSRFFSVNSGGKKQANVHPLGRWPANLLWLDPMYADYDKYFMVPKPDRFEKGSYNEHTTVKPLRLMEHLIKLVTPKSSAIGEEVTVLDPYMGSGTTGAACKVLGRSFVGFEKDEVSFRTAKLTVARPRDFDIFER